MRIERVADGLGLAEGPAFLPDGRVVCVEIWRSRVSEWTPPKGVKEHAYVGGGPNAVCVGSTGSLYITQNGGRGGDPAWRAGDERVPSIQKVSPAGEVSVVATAVGGFELSAPNDLAFGPDGRLYFTDPVGDYDPQVAPPPGRLCALAPDGSGAVLHDTGPTFPNGIAIDQDGDVIWTESFTRTVRRLHVETGAVELLHTFDPPCVPDGLAIAETGDLYIATILSGGVDVLAPDGSYKQRLDVGGLPTNCAFRGSRLVVTDAGTGTGKDPPSAWTGGLYTVDFDDVAGMVMFRGEIGEG